MTEVDRPHRVVAVVGGCGGVGASTFAAVLAASAASAVLVDIDALGGGLDVVLGIEQVPGVRWSGLRLGGGRLEPALLAKGLPKWGAVPVLAADCRPASQGAVGQVIDACAELGTVVIDIGRAPGPQRELAVERSDFVVVVVAADVAGLAAARATVAGLRPAAVGVVVRRGPVPAAQAAGLTGAPLVGVVSGRRGDDLDVSRPPRRLARVAAGVLDGVALPSAGIARPLRDDVPEEVAS